MRRWETVTPKRQRATRQAAIHDDTRVPLEPTPDGLGVKVIASTYQRRGLGLQSDGARCYNSQSFTDNRRHRRLCGEPKTTANSSQDGQARCGSADCDR